MFLATVLTLPPSHTDVWPLVHTVAEKTQKRLAFASGGCGWHSLRVGVARGETGILPEGILSWVSHGKKVGIGMHV